MSDEAGAEVGETVHEVEAKEDSNGEIKLIRIFKRSGDREWFNDAKFGFTLKFVPGDFVVESEPREVRISSRFERFSTPIVKYGDLHVSRLLEDNGTEEHVIISYDRKIRQFAYDAAHLSNVDTVLGAMEDGFVYKKKDFGDQLFRANYDDDGEEVAIPPKAFTFTPTFVTLSYFCTYDDATLQYAYLDETDTSTQEVKLEEEWKDAIVATVGDIVCFVSKEEPKLLTYDLEKRRSRLLTLSLPNDLEWSTIRENMQLTVQRGHVQLNSFVLDESGEHIFYEASNDRRGGGKPRRFGNKRFIRGRRDNNRPRREEKSEPEDNNAEQSKRRNAKPAKPWDRNHPSNNRSFAELEARIEEMHAMADLTQQLEADFDVHEKRVNDELRKLKNACSSLAQQMKNLREEFKRLQGDDGNGEEDHGHGQNNGDRNHGNRRHSNRMFRGRRGEQ